MTTIRQIITDSLREGGILGLGETPSSDSLDEGLRRLQSMYSSLFGNELGEPLVDVNYGQAGLTNSFAKEEDDSSNIDSLYIPDNARLIFNLNSAERLYLNPSPRDGQRFGIVDNGGNLSTHNVTIDGNGRQIEAADSVTLVTDGLVSEWFYRADLGSWVKVIDLDVDNQSPLPTEFDDLLITLLAFRLNPRYGATTDGSMIETMKRIRRIFRARYRQVSEQLSEIGMYRLPSTRLYWQTGNNMNTFNRGRP